MTPRIETVMRLRYAVRAVLRALMLVLAVYVTIRFATALLGAVFLGGFGPRANEFLAGRLLSVVGIALVVVAYFVAEHRLLRWIFPVPRLVCPECGYRFVRGLPDRCSECGTRLRSEAAGSDPLNGQSS
jgi:hypothetical protein